MWIGAYFDTGYILGIDVRSVPKFTENLYSICLGIHKSILKQTQYNFAVNIGTLSMYTVYCYILI